MDDYSKLYYLEIEGKKDREMLVQSFWRRKKCDEFFLKENLGEKNHGRVFLSRKTPIRHQGRFYQN